MPHTTVTPTSHATQGPSLFTTRQDLDHELTTTRTWKALHAAVHASTPRLTSHAHRNHGQEAVCGLRFTEDTPHRGQARTRGSIIVSPDGHLTVRAYTIPGHRWLTALRHLGALDPKTLRPGPGARATVPAEQATPSWSVRPHVKHRSFSGHLQLADHVKAQTLTGLPDAIGDVNAQLTIAPDTRAACPAAWLLATGFFHALTTGAPAHLRP
ncbi:hypothetical protein AB0G86_18650 [Streptomyces scabiei]|uniref:hypothetical protein n=1 Tax=Streptomyces scabiei TaxID=1930 RepID=UPI0034071D7E